ncbi:hypothetical protein AC1031_019023 [Aphanomyces cochlioides]|nr:hypothetical protein AC1031_019023 [Aphanomyces cochlioides]
MFATELAPRFGNGRQLYPPELAAEIDELNGWIYSQATTERSYITSAVPRIWCLQMMQSSVDSSRSSRNKSQRTLRAVFLFPASLFSPLFKLKALELWLVLPPASAQRQAIDDDQIPKAGNARIFLGTYQCIESPVAVTCLDVELKTGETFTYDTAGHHHTTEELLIFSDDGQVVTLEATIDEEAISKRFEILKKWTALPHVVLRMGTKQANTCTLTTKEFKTRKDKTKDQIAKEILALDIEAYKQQEPKPEEHKVKPPSSDEVAPEVRSDITLINRKHASLQPADTTKKCSEDEEETKSNNDDTEAKRCVQADCQWKKEYNMAMEKYNSLQEEYNNCQVHTSMSPSMR